MQILLAACDRRETGFDRLGDPASIWIIQHEARTIPLNHLLIN
jgi:hypothetical protein